MEVQSFFHIFYSSQGHTATTELLQFVPERVTGDMNMMLDKPYEPEEVHATLFQMSPSKASGVDGFTAIFFKGIGILFKEI